ncbi:hypothetical protein ACFXCZ_03585 [Streptomyces sp. NPDC059396]|uniref:SbtR family transcriptional regulator n=1 Tax=Streptomyces sp. NPDC059396 TaxID=3346819 RepID=UPI00367D7F85
MPAKAAKPVEPGESTGAGAVAEAGESTAAGDSETPGVVLAAWLHRFFAFSTSKRHIASELLEHTDRDNPLFQNNRSRVLAAARPLLTAAQRTHEVRDDLTLEQVLDMVIAISTIHGDTGYLDPILQTALDGLRPRPV